MLLICPGKIGLGSKKAGAAATSPVVDLDAEPSASLSSESDPTELAADDSRTATAAAAVGCALTDSVVICDAKPVVAPNGLMKLDTDDGAVARTAAVGLGVDGALPFGGTTGLVFSFFEAVRLGRGVGRMAAAPDP